MAKETHPAIAHRKFNEFSETMEDFMLWDSSKGIAEVFNDCIYIVTTTKDEAFDKKHRRNLMFRMQQNQELLLEIKELWPMVKEHIENLNK